MNQAFQELDFQQTSIGEISLRRRVLPSEEVVYEVKLDQAFLMSSMFHAVEEALADLGLAELGAGAWDVVVGGLGLGYTAVAVLAHQTIQSLTVIDLLAPVIEWHQKGLVPLGPLLTADARCRLLEGDFFALAAGPTGFDAGRRFHAVLLDIDHSPSNLLHPRHGSFYTTAGLQAMSAHLQPRSVFAMWSDDPPDEAFLELLRTVFGQVRAEIVTFPNPLLDCDSASTVYVCRTE